MAEPRGILGGICPPSTPKFFFYQVQFFLCSLLTISMSFSTTLEGKCSLLKVKVWKWYSCSCRKTIVRQMPPYSHCIKTKSWRRMCRWLTRLGFGVLGFAQGRRGWFRWVWRSFKCIEKEDNIYIFLIFLLLFFFLLFFVANEWLGYCIAIGLILNMEMGENIRILEQALCPSLISTVATVQPQLPCLSVTLTNTATMMLTERLIYIFYI